MHGNAYRLRNVLDLELALVLEFDADLAADRTPRKHRSLREEPRFRPEFRPPWTGQAHVTVLPLTRLGRREGTALVKSVAGDAPIPTDVLGEIVDRTDGVPLFVEELTQAVLETGAGGRGGRDAVSALPRAVRAVRLPCTPRSWRASTASDPP
jgi:hypothetical protein